jgi:hypothetical protein
MGVISSVELPCTIRKKKRESLEYSTDVPFCLAESTKFQPVTWKWKIVRFMEQDEAVLCDKTSKDKANVMKYGLNMASSIWQYLQLAGQFQECAKMAMEYIYLRIQFCFIVHSQFYTGIDMVRIVSCSVIGVLTQ